MKISYAKFAEPKKGTLILLTGEGLKFPASAAALGTGSGDQLRRAAGVAGFSGKKSTFLDIVAPSGVAAERILLVGIGEPGALEEQGWVKLGGAIAGKLAGLGGQATALRAEVPEGFDVDPAALTGALALGLSLRDYRFDRHKTQADDDESGMPASVTIQSASPAAARRAGARSAATATGVNFARDLINEPPNVLHPAAFASRLASLKKLGVEVESLARRDIEKLKMGALLAVAQGSRHEPRVAVLTWRGRGKEAPLAFIGKGVTFDSGGLSLKPATSMTNMKSDMSGAACVAGLIHTLAARKAKVNAVGVLGLVENMPDGNAVRPGDVVTSMSGRTIEVLNTDAEGRLVLADILHYARERFSPAAMIDLATLTGAIVTALGKLRAGLFATDDELAEHLCAAGSATGEKVWRMPLGPEYDKLINSTVADMKNTGGRGAGAITAAQFLHRFVGDTPWAHLDIAGTATGEDKSDIAPSWAKGYGVRLLDRLVADHYEGR